MRHQSLSHFLITKILTVLPLQGKIRPYPANINLFKANNRNTRTKCEICSKLTIKTPEWRQSLRSSVFIVNFEHISHFLLVFLLLFLFGVFSIRLGRWAPVKWNKSRLAMYYVMHYHYGYYIKHSKFPQHVNRNSLFVIIEHSIQKFNWNSFWMFSFQAFKIILIKFLSINFQRSIEYSRDSLQTIRKVIYFLKRIFDGRHCFIQEKSDLLHIYQDVLILATLIGKDLSAKQKEF